MDEKFQICWKPAQGGVIVLQFFKGQADFRSFVADRRRDKSIELIALDHWVPISVEP